MTTPATAPPRGPTSDRYVVIGAGPSGLAALHRLRQAGLGAECLEQADEVGGTWNTQSPHSSVWGATHLISSKRLTEFPDFRMPRAYPHYPSQAQVWDYLRSYADHFDLYPAIRFGAAVERVLPVGGQWEVWVRGESVGRRYQGVVVANGHHWQPLVPQWPGEFEGRVLHAHDYKSPDVLTDKRVLVVGAGNSGCDIAVESAMHARRTVLSMRRGYYFLPKYLFGVPLDRCGASLYRWHLPRWCHDGLARLLVHVAVGPPQRYGLPRPDHRLFQSHPIVNSQLPYFVGHGRVHVRPDVVRLDGKEVHFCDGSKEPFDVVVLATGYQIQFPFLDPRVLSGDDVMSKLYLNAFHTEHADLSVIGLVQPNGGIWPLSDLQAQVLVRWIVARVRGLRIAESFHRQRAAGGDGRPSARQYVDSPRHRIEVDYHRYSRRLQRIIRRFDRALGQRITT